MNERIKRLRAQSLSAAPRISLERALIETDTVKRLYGKVSVPVMRATVLYDYMKERKLYLGRDELIVGEKGDYIQTAPTFPELCCHSIEDMRLMSTRKLISFNVQDGDITLQQNTIIPFWQGRTMRERILAAMTPEWKNAYESGIFTEFMEQRGPGHTVGSENIFNRGFEERKREIENRIREGGSTEQLEELKAMLIACDAVLILGERYRKLCLKTAEGETDEQRRRELFELADVFNNIPRNRPNSFREALQLYWLVHLCVTTELNPWDAYSPGRLDQHLYPYYQRDIVSGRLTRQGAKELLECLWVKFNNQPAPPKVGITLKESGTYTDFANINTGGVTPNGGDGVNEVSYLILECMDEMLLLQPSSNVQISEKTPDEFLLRAVDIARKGWGQPAFYNTEAIISELMNAGKSYEDALRGGTSGCVETGAFGNEAYILTGYFNLPKILELALNDGYDHERNLQLGPKTGRAESFSSFEELYAAYEKQLSYFIDIKIQGSNAIGRLYAEYMPVPFLSVITNDCIQKARDYNAGGARYNTSYLQGVGTGTVTDSLCAIKYHVFERQSVGMAELAHALHSDFVGEEALRGRLYRHTPRYGNDDEYADSIMRRVFMSYYERINGRPNERGGTWRVNMLPTTCHVYFGEVTGASADGRRAHTPVSEGISPVQGTDRNGPTAVVNSASKMPQLLTGGTLLNQKFTPSVVSGERGRQAMAALIRGYFQNEGHHIQFNVVDRATLIAAQSEPEKYANLIVRVAGYSDRFCNLSKALQDEIITRTEQTV